ncbi:MAG: AAA family ATPase [Verrucomicrobiia bacterium]
MLLDSVRVGPFKSINRPEKVVIDEEVTVFVGMNEAGKTVFLQALEKSNDALGSGSFDPVEDYPRKDLPPYLKKHKTEPEEVVVLTYKLTDSEREEVKEKTKINLGTDFRFSVHHDYDNGTCVTLKVDEKPLLDSYCNDLSLSSDVRTSIAKANSISEIPKCLQGIGLTDEDKEILAALEARIAKAAKAEWASVASLETWEFLRARIPKFLYFGDYQILPSKMNLADLARRVDLAKTDPKQLETEHKALLALLRMADISISDFTKPGGYESLKAKIEAVSINLTDQVMKFWKQNEDLEVEVDIKTDADDLPPYNSGANLYLRIKNRRHRGVSTPFRQRSRGFIWFFSFLVWFDDVKHQLAASRESGVRDLILLLDEPGLSLHALAQADFLRYIDELAKKHQVLYTTHSPFMVHADRLSSVRLVEDRKTVGTVVSDNLTGSDPRTLFPLQAALGWTIAQNLFISERNLLVEGPADLIYMQAVSNILEAQGRVGLREDVTIVPTGGLDKLATFIALLGGNGLKLAVLHDYRGSPEQKLMELVKQKMISPKLILNVSQFRVPNETGKDGKATDLEDLFPIGLYLVHFNRAFKKLLRGSVVAEGDLPPGERIIDRLERHLKDKGISFRADGTFNHYAVASDFASNPPPSLDSETTARFEALFKSVNALF